MSKTLYTPEHPLLFDGAIGTLFAALPGRAGERCERASLDHPEEIAAIHRAYLEAGARAIKTNTFSVGTDLAQGNEKLADALIDAGSRLALETAAPFGALVFADLGPVPGDAGALFRRQAERFLRAGLTHFLVETLSSDEGVPELAAWLRERCQEAFLLVSFAVGPDGFTREGLPGRALLERTAALPGVDAVGFNCMSGPHHLLSLVRGLRPEGAMLSVMPNAGYPTVLGRRTVYQGTPDYFAQQTAQIVHAGAAIVGGCCGAPPPRRRVRPSSPPGPAPGGGGRPVAQASAGGEGGGRGAGSSGQRQHLRLPLRRAHPAGRGGRCDHHRRLSRGPAEGGQLPAGLQGQAGAGH